MSLETIGQLGENIKVFFVVEKLRASRRIGLLSTRKEMSEGPRAALDYETNGAREYIEWFTVSSILATILSFPSQKSLRTFEGFGWPYSEVYS